MKALVNTFIVFHLVALLSWGLPESIFNGRIAALFGPYINRMGLWHVWDMFAPTPLTINFHCEGLVTFKDGSTEVWEFPQMEKLSLFKKIPRERYRKWLERVRQDGYSPIWDDTAVFIARQCNPTPANPPVRVALTRIWGDIPPPQPGDYQPFTVEFAYPNRYTFHVCDILPEDLE